ncbi:MAG TPA: hypothetical protein VEY33_04915 [Gemmatimonadota bacterium]|nr:hypothetical protein [Gemmatimonadota bacterium]
MNRSTVFTVAALVTVAGLVGFAACSDTQPTEPLLQDGIGDMLAAHSPAHLGASGMASLASTPTYTELDGASASETAGSLKLAVDAGGDIARHSDNFIRSVAVFGYAWADLATGQALVAVIHPVIGRDSRQNPDGWHTHSVELTGGTASSDFCIVSIGRSQGGIAIHDDTLRVNTSRQWAGISAADLDVAAAFVVQVDAGCTTTGLGVAVLDAETL